MQFNVVKLYFLHIQASLIETIYVCVRHIYVDVHKDSLEEDELMKKVFMEILDVEIKSGLSNIFPSGKTQFLADYFEACKSYRRLNTMLKFRVKLTKTY